MIRERRSREKLEAYYHKFIQEGILDPNVHPWVAQSWERSRDLGVSHDKLAPAIKLSKAELEALRQKHKPVLEFLDGMYREINEFFTIHNLSLLLLDHECYTLESYAMPFFQKTPGELRGTRLSEEDTGTSSISIAFEHKVPFLMFGPEMWIEECQAGDACSAPIIVDNEVKYILALVAVEQQDMPYTAMLSLLVSMRVAIESHLKTLYSLEARHAILDAVPLALYHILPGGEVAYSNRLGHSRLSGIDPQERKVGHPLKLSDLVLNYEHTPLYKGFMGIPSYNKEVTWITPRKTYEDITTVVPLYDEDEVKSIVAVSLPIEDLRTLVAHAAGYTARYNLASMVGQTPVFLAMKEKAGRAAKSQHHLLLQGEAGTGKQRLAHGIHQASPRAAGPLIAIRCGDMPPELLEGELFGTLQGREESRPGKLELANGGTLFLDEVEKIPLNLGTKLAQALKNSTLQRVGEDIDRSFDVRVIAACDNDLKRLTEKGLFVAELYELLTKTLIKIPPLRMRREDIPLLARHIIDELAVQHHMPVKQLTPQAAQMLVSYEWPGNVKQLQGVVEQAFFHTEEAAIESDGIVLPGEMGISQAWKEDKALFMEAWKAAGGNVSRLANRLDVSRVTLYRYLKKYGLEKN